MLKVMITDDEALVRIGIKTTIPWIELGFELVGEAENGKKALEMAREFKPDIILSDIKMPLLNGLELLKKLKDEGNQAKFIMLSAYDDFEYVKEALKNGAYDYILKLELEPDHLIRILSELRAEILSNRVVSSPNVAIATETPFINTSLIKDKFYKDLIFGVIQKREEVVEPLDRYHLQFPEQNLICLLIEVDDEQIYIKYGESPHLLDYSILNIIEEVVTSYAYGHVISLERRRFVAILSLLDKREYPSEHTVNDVTGNIRTTLRKYLSTSVCIGISRIYQEYTDIQKMFRQAKEANLHKFSYPRGSDILYQDICHLSLEDSEDISEEMKDMENALLYGDVHEIEHTLNKIIEKMIASNKLTKDLLTGLCYTLYYMYQSFVEKYQLTDKGIITKEMYSRIDKMNLKDDFVEWVSYLKNRTIEQLINNNENMRVYKAKQYINNSYKEELSLERVATHLELSSGYLSNLFKRETGQNFVDYLTEVRINNAKVLLRTTNLKNAEIAREVGYMDEYYFSKVFKKITGLSPTKYRE
ncbi:response regulator [Paenibacillus sp. CMAA1364]